MSDFGKLYVVGTPIGNLSDFSPRGIETLENADYIAAEDTRVTMKLLAKFDIKKPLLSCYKPKEQEKSEKIVELLLEGNVVAMVSDAGMPCISDPGYVLVKKCYDKGIPVEVIPGCNAAVSAVAVSGLRSERWIFEGFLPVDKKERRQQLEEVKNLSHTLVYYEAPHKLCRTLTDLCGAFGGDRPAALCRELTKVHEEVIRGTLEELLHHYDNAEPRGEYVIVVEGKEPEKQSLSFEEAVQMAEKLTEEGMKLSEACKQVSEFSNIPKREIYAALAKRQ